MTLLNTTVKSWYKKNYSDDEMGNDMQAKTTFADIYDCLLQGKSICSVIFKNDNEIDSVIRERIFDGLSGILRCDYDVIYYLWLNNEN